MVVINHWGIWVNSEIPTTGVFGNNEIEFLLDDPYIDLQHEEHKEECENCREGDSCDWEDFSDSTKLIGFEECDLGDLECIFQFKVQNKGLRINRKAEYSVIIHEATSQVLHSEWCIKGALCSPCYPGQVDAGTPGEFLGYAFPPDVVGEYAKELTERIFHL